MLTGEAKRDYQRAYMQKRRLIAKNSDNVILAQKQGLENAPESATINDNVTIDNVTPRIVTSNRNNIVTDKFPLTHEQLEKQGYYWPYWLTENTASRDKEGRVKVA